jgi:hypothetical protein
LNARRRVNSTVGRLDFRMKAFLIVTVLLAGASRSVAQREFVAFENVDAEFKSLADVHPVVANRGRQTIYLWPQNCREALVSHLQRDGYWYDGDRKPCPRITKPIVLKPGQTYRILPLVMRVDFVDHFDENRVGVPGKFKIAMFYSFRPVYTKGPPHMRETLTKEFTIVP